MMQLAFNDVTKKNKSSDLFAHSGNVVNVTSDIFDQAMAWVHTDTSYRIASFSSIAMLKFLVKDENASINTLWNDNIDRLYALIQRVYGVCNILNDGTRILVLGQERPYKWFVFDRNDEQLQESFDALMI
jgi:hypothetical protein